MRGSVIGVICISRTSKLDESVQIVGQIVVSFQGLCPWTPRGAYDPSWLICPPLQNVLARLSRHTAFQRYAPNLKPLNFHKPKSINYIIIYGKLGIILIFTFLNTFGLKFMRLKERLVLLDNAMAHA